MASLFPLFWTNVFWQDVSRWSAETLLTPHRAQSPTEADEDGGGGVLGGVGVSGGWGIILPEEWLLVPALRLGGPECREGGPPRLVLRPRSPGMSPQAESWALHCSNWSRSAAPAPMLEPSCTHGDKPHGEHNNMLSIGMGIEGFKHVFEKGM